MDAVRVPRWLPAIFLVLLLCVAGEARAIFRAYLSVNGSDTNPCTLAAPCRLLPAALTAVDDGGEIWMLDSGNFNAGPVIVDKSVTILAIPGAQGSLVVTTSRAIDVNGPGIRVTLRNIGFRDLNSTGYGAIYYLQGASLVVDGCRFANIAGGGLYGSATGSLVVNDSVFRHNGAMGIDLSGDVDAVIANSEVVQNGIAGVTIQGNVKVVVRDSVIAGNGGGGIHAQAHHAGTAQLLLDRTTLSGNFGAGLIAFGSAAGGLIQAVVTRSTFTGNVVGISADTFAGGATTVVIDSSTFAQQPRGVHVGGTATVRTRQNNVFNYHTVADVDGTLTVHPGI